MPSKDPIDSVPMPALLVERAIDLARAEAGLALVHTRRVAVRGISALLGTIVACAFAQLTLVLLVAWPALSERVPLANLLGGVLVSVLLAVAGAAFAAITWTSVAREGSRKAQRAAGPLSESPPLPAPAARPYDTQEQSSAANLAQRVGA